MAQVRPGKATPAPTLPYIFSNSARICASLVSLRFPVSIFKGTCMSRSMQKTSLQAPNHDCAHAKESMKPGCNGRNGTAASTKFVSGVRDLQLEMKALEGHQHATKIFPSHFSAINHEHGRSLPH